MNTLKITFSLLLTMAFVGCANLKEVRDFASESARLSAYSELTTRFRDTYERERPYLDGEADRLAQEYDKKRKAAYGDFLKIHQRVSLYMQTLAALAGEDTFDLSRGAASLASGINAYPEFGFDRNHADAISNISQVITRWASSAYQESAVRSMIKEGDAPLQITLRGMITLVRYYKKTNENERKEVLGFFEKEIAFIDPNDKLLKTLARTHEQSKISEYRNAQLIYDDAEKGLNSIAEGHKQLFDNIDSMSTDQIKAISGKFARDIRTIRESLPAVRG